MERFSAWLGTHKGRLDAAALATVIPGMRVCLDLLSRNLSPEFRFMASSS